MYSATTVTSIDCPACGIAAYTGIATVSDDGGDAGPITSCGICRLEVHGTVRGAITAMPRAVSADEVIRAACRLRPELHLDDPESLFVEPWDRNA